MLDEFNIKMVNGAPRHSQSQGSVERGNKDIEDLLYTWMSTNKTSRWADDLPSITRYHRGLGMSPYEAFLGVKPRFCLANLNLDKEVTNEIWTEEQLNKVLEIEEAPIEYQIEAPGLRNVINLVQDQVSTLAEGELANSVVSA